CEFNGFVRDITKQKESDDLIWNQANFDSLTGLPNRHMFHDRLMQEIKKAHRASLRTALLFIDLDKFKEVNDTLGHSMGDILLKEAAHRIGGCVRDTDTVARLGGDEFTVILAELDDTGSVERIAENVLQSLANPFRLGNEMAYISASIGITLYPNDATEAEDLLKNADQAMYAAKNGGRNRFSYFTQSMQQTAQARLRLTNELRGALAANQFRIHYQPIVDLATGRINKAEALIRWQHPELGMVSPAQFIPLAEETGLIIEIGDWIFKESARQLKLWRKLYNTGFQISVNVSPIQLGNTIGSSYKTWFSYLQELGLPGQGMVIEITEGLLLDASSGITSKLLEFRDAGIQAAIDDFGTGYSSLSYLKKFDIDYLKIDQSFVRGLVTDPDDMALSEAIILMAHKLGLKVIAEGVETEAQRKLLIEAGCDHAQGYLFSKPVPAEKFEELLKGQQPESPHYQI
ncbi:MAG TPA: EAL domain-containing protein, partial [Gallionella sp.]|nr:EAL domain-containing protein [Gallionella sp.]